MNETSPVPVDIDEPTNLDIALAEPDEMPATVAEWIEEICKIDGIAGLENWKKLVQRYVILNMSMFGKDKKTIINCLAAQEAKLMKEIDGST